MRRAGRGLCWEIGRQLVMGGTDNERLGAMIQKWRLNGQQGEGCTGLREGFDHEPIMTAR